MKDDKAMSSNDAMQLGAFFKLIFQHGLAIEEREIAHSINNHLSVLSMQINMLSRALSRQDTKLVLRKSDEIQETAKRIQDYAESLSSNGHQPMPLISTDLTQVINNTINFVKTLPEMQNLEIDWAAPQDFPEVKCYPDGVKLALLSYIHSVAQLIETPHIKITIGHNHRGMPQISCDLLSSPQPGVLLKFPLDATRSPGATPMRQLKRILESEENNLQIMLAEGDSLGLVCTFG